MTPHSLVPPGLLGLMFQHIWFAFIVFTIINARAAWKRSVQPKIDKELGLRDGYRSLYRGSLFWMNVPWALMGAGIVSGRVEIVHEYLGPAALRDVMGGI